MEDDRSDEYLFQTYSWDTPQMDPNPINLSEKSIFDEVPILNLKGEDFKFYFPKMEERNAPVIDKLEDFDNGHYQCSNQNASKKDCHHEVKPGEANTPTQANHQDVTVNDSNCKERKNSESGSSHKAETVHGSTRDNETDTKSERAVSQTKDAKEEQNDETFNPDGESVKPEDDPDFFYKAPRKNKFEYNKRKDVILKTILRKCRRILQDQFNELTGYFPNKKMHGPQFFKDCIAKFHDSIECKPEQLDLLFYLGAMLYPQEMSRGIDCFFECDSKERVKFRKVHRAKIQKVHDVLYRYSHEKMDYFTSVPELCYLYAMFYKEEVKKQEEDVYYMNGATEIFERCYKTLTDANITV
jgi:hypothetical protein